MLSSYFLIRIHCIHCLIGAKVSFEASEESTAHRSSEQPTNYFIVMDWMFSSHSTPKFICYSLNVQSDGIWRWGLWEVISVGWGPEGEAPQWDQHPSKKREGPEPPPPPPLRSVWGHSVGSGSLSLGTRSASTLISDFSVSKAMRNQCLFSELLSLWHFVTAAWAD